MKKVVCIALCILLILATASCAEEKEEGKYYDIVVYVSRYNKIHSYPNCSNMVYFTPMFLSIAIKERYIICKKCKDDLDEAIYEYNRHYNDHYEYPEEE